MSLPPSSHQFRHGHEKGEMGGCSEEFYSPRLSLNGKGSSRRLAAEQLSSSQWAYPMAIEKCGSQNLMLSTPSYLSSMQLPSGPHLSPPLSSSTTITHGPQLASLLTSLPHVRK
ncbi:hypothetical protein BHE74_00008379 [Ensete ventricosum]|nr:hypothetical protein GW17_00008814 [Ensete ventricosum]RWW83129.1 hypothetical protein BHE74_00008379 [Ensete ventricosum]RZR83135.1 hypothetical protein BHM03_00009691 [Ensete ventricosum]